MGAMRIDLDGRTIGFAGEHNPVADAAFAALHANGGREAEAPDLLLLSFPLVANEAADVAELLEVARAFVERMAGDGGARAIFLVSAVAGLPMRRHPRFSVQMAAVLATMRGLAMAGGPGVLVNAVGVGAIGEPVIAGDAAMLTHASTGRPGTISEVADAVLFFADPLNTYTTGQLLSVDGGWTAGYGRNF